MINSILTFSMTTAAWLRTELSVMFNDVSVNKKKIYKQIFILIFNYFKEYLEKHFYFSLGWEEHYIYYSTITAG